MCGLVSVFSICSYAHLFILDQYYVRVPEVVTQLNDVLLTLILFCFVFFFLYVLFWVVFTALSSNLVFFPSAVSKVLLISSM